MAYNRAPQVVIAGAALKQTPPVTATTPPGIVPVVIDANIATTTELGVIKVGSGLSISAQGVLSASGSEDCCRVDVKLTGQNYLISDTECYIGATKNNITLTLPLGQSGKLYYIKNQSTGNIKVQGSGGQKIDSSSDKSLGSESGFIVVFDGTRWNTI